MLANIAKSLRIVWVIFTKTMKQIVAVCLFAILFASCTGSRYGHYGYVKRGGDKIIEKSQSARKQAVKQPERLANKASGISVANYNDTALPQSISMPVSNKSGSVLHVITNEENESQSAVATIITENEENPKPNKKAIGSLGYGIVAYVVILIPILGIAFSISFAIVAIRRGMDALREMDAEPEKYTNRGAAIAGVALGTIFLAILIFAILMLMISAVGFTIPFLPFF